MGLLSYLQRQRPDSPGSEAGADPVTEPSVTPDAVAQARARALRRLVGASLLLAVGVIGFPLLFETQPRPIRLDLPIELVRKDSTLPAQPITPIPQPAATPVAEPAAEPLVLAASAPGPLPKPPPTMLTERAGDQGREVAVAAAASRPQAAAAAASAAPPAPPITAAPPAPSAEAVRARALLEGQAAAPADAASASSRIIVQVGAYADADKLREVRSKVEKLGLKTYTQVVDSDGQKKTRVRVGPFATRAEADRTAARLREAGMPVAVLTL